MATGVNLAVVGATGAVGRELLSILAERKFPVNEILCLASPQEVGQTIDFNGEKHTVKAADTQAFKKADIAFFAVDTDISKTLAPLALDNDCMVIDNSNAFRLDEKVPLIVPEVNPNDAKNHQGIIANPNCSTIIMVVAINPIHKAAGIKRVIVSTYQAVSGAGINGLRELTDHTRAYLSGDENPTPEVFQYPIAFNIIPHIDNFVQDDYTREEMKMVWETQKIMHAPALKIAPTAVRVPVFRSHCEAIYLETEQPLSAAQARAILSEAPGVKVQDDPDNKVYPMPKYASNTDAVYVGRIRKDISVENGLALWVAADQIRKGAATNSVQIAELVYDHNLY